MAKIAPLIGHANRDSMGLLRGMGSHFKRPRVEVIPFIRLHLFYRLLKLQCSDYLGARMFGLSSNLTIGESPHPDTLRGYYTSRKRQPAVN